MHARLAIPADSVSIAKIDNHGIGDRTATFETRPRAASEVRAWFDETHPIVIVEEGAEVLAFAATSSYRPRACYAGIAEVSVYVDSRYRVRGAGRPAGFTRIDASGRAGGLLEASIAGFP